MKNLKKVMALVLAGALTFGSMSMASFAAPAPVDAGSFDGTLTVNGTAAGDVISFYKLVEWVGDATGNVSGWAATSTYAGILTEAKLTEVLLGDPDATPAVAPTGITPALAAQLSAAAKGDSPVQSGDGTTLDVTNQNTKGPGIYMALITPSDADTVYNPVFVSSDFNLTAAGEISVTSSYTDGTAKKSTTSLDKTAETSEDNWDDLKWQTAAIGDTVTFTVVTTVPAYGEAYNHPHFAVKDKLTDLDLVSGSVKVTSPALVKDTDYRVTETGNGYTLEFTEPYLKSNTAAVKVTIEYDALVSTTAPKHVNTEKNEVSTEFSHTPTSENDYSFKKDTTEHYTFTIDADILGGDEKGSGKKTKELVKIGQNADGTPISSERIVSEISGVTVDEAPLAGAKFKLYTDPDCTVEYQPKKADGTPDSPLTIESQTDGRITGIIGLDAGTYYIQETQAPTGYVKDTRKVKIEIKAETSLKTVTEYTTDGTTWISQSAYNDLPDKTGYKAYTFETETLDSYKVFVDGEDTASYTFINKGTDAVIEWETETKPGLENPFGFTNKKGFELPSTGGIGTTIFYIVGVILVLGAGVVLVTRRRVNS